MRKIIQISVTSPADEDYPHSVYALCNDNTIWTMADSDHPKWSKLPDIPQTEVEEVFGKLPPVDELKEALEQGKSIYIHCKAGRGRSAAVAVATLCQLLYASVDDAIDIVQKARTQVSLNQKQQKPIQDLVAKVN